MIRSRYSRERHPWANAMGIIADRAYAHPAYALTVKCACAIALTRVRGLHTGYTPEQSIALMRAIGGMTVIVREAIDEAIRLTPGAADSVGSPMIPATVGSEVRTVEPSRIGTVVSLAFSRGLDSCDSYLAPKGRK